jgi:cytochrome c oxidase subunit IV
MTLHLWMQEQWTRMQLLNAIIFLGYVQVLIHSLVILTHCNYTLNFRIHISIICKSVFSLQW